MISFLKFGVVGVSNTLITIAMLYAACILRGKLHRLQYCLLFIRGF